MPVYVLLTKFLPRALRNVLDEPPALNGIRETLEAYEANIIGDFRLMGAYDHCTVFDVTDNFRAYKACLEQDLGRGRATMDVNLLAGSDAGDGLSRGDDVHAVSLRRGGAE